MYIGYSIPQVSDRLEDVVKAMQRYYF
ncbi:hypothetical protein [Alicyclobacillus ferrooxydans]